MVNALFLRSRFPLVLLESLRLDVLGLPLSAEPNPKLVAGSERIRPVLDNKGALSSVVGSALSSSPLTPP